MARGGQTGRIHLHQRNTDDIAQVIGADNAITAEHADDIIATEQRAMEDKTRKEYRLRIARIYKWQVAWERHLLRESTEYIQERMEANFLKNDGSSWIVCSKKH